MAKWLILAVGVFLFLNGMFARVSDFPNQTVPEYCFIMDYIYLYGCFRNSAIPKVVVWGAVLIGATLIAWSFILGQRLRKV
jgi:hypothetical protein